MLAISLCYRQIMQPKSFFSLIVIALFLLGTAGLWKISNSNKQSENEPIRSIKGNSSQPHHEPKEVKKAVKQKATTQVNKVAEIEALINNNDIALAVSSINQHHSSLSSEELNYLKLTLVSQAFTQTKSEKKSTLSLASKVFDEVEIWELLGDAALADSDWPLAYSAQLRASELQNDSIKLGNLLDKLSISSSHLRKNYEQSGDLISIKGLYQDLANRHPSFPRFNYELAISMINLGELDIAKPMLESLSYDPELGRLAKQTLSKLNNSLAPPQTSTDTTASLQPQTKRNDLVVPLTRLGNSFIVNSAIERVNASLLLDTGASITSLSSELITRLNLADTGRSISLSTANGVTQAKLYKVNRLQLGSVLLRNMIVAEINLSSRGSFQGLLGTDALNQLAPHYNYLIDNQKGALIFSPTN